MHVFRLLGVVVLGACAQVPVTPSIAVNEQIIVVTPRDGGQKQTLTKAAKVIVNARKPLRIAAGRCVIETTMLVNVAKHRVRDVDVTLPKVRTTRYPVECASTVAFEATPDDVVQMDLEETWFVDQVRSTTQEGDQVMSISLTSLMVGSSIRRDQNECREERLILEKVDVRHLDEADVILPTTRVETTPVPCPAPYTSSR